MVDRQTFRINANSPALPGILPEVGLTRLYPHGTDTAHVVGYVGRVSERDINRIESRGEKIDPVLQLPEFQIGKTGIERALEDDLRGRAGTRRVEVNARGRVIRAAGPWRRWAPCWRCLAGKLPY